MSRTQRRSDIHRLLKEKRKSSLTPYQQHAWQILNGLNTPTLLETIQSRFPSRYLCYGPKAINGIRPIPHTGVVIWYRPPGYYRYKSLSLFGIWAVDDPTTIIVGLRTLPFSAYFYQPEAYFHRIRTDFSTDYGQNAPPPDENRNILLKTPYDAKRRLELRREIEAIVNHWRETFI